ncbi:MULTISPECIES: acyl-CoA carboxylase subunit beta [Anaerolinea]|uniref:Methylmalonyl-CoA decarboxylase alpha-subunit n=1 Tax=Anaerolinea thermophila (strain DSM 14523 / JCM 11388 / NBRC 100420 / UNI-1) TaxID=926569 RepID=E8N1K9_ANATU|nr:MULTISPECIES: acyl-CoA carboxylase subunit beta [Anaerolinea]BAJ62614.1 putative methylmalonyl-CoA decarboxylase alpha-subunit [Anaerolinea thermophila UNI-1]
MTESNVNAQPTSGEAEQRDERQHLYKKLQEYREKLLEAGGKDRIEAQHAKGKLTARERIEKLLDEGTFQEIDAFMVHRHSDFGMDKSRFLGDGVVAGFGKIDGRRVCVFSQDFTVLGGSFGEVAGQKVCKILDMAMDAGVPVIGLNDSGGARIQEGVHSLSAYGEVFYRNTLASGVIPQISVMLGPCAGGAVYSPALMDFIIMTKGISNMFITGPEVIKTVTAEVVDAETLGGAMAHSTISGVAHFATENEEESFATVRRLLSYLPLNNSEPAPAIEPYDDPNRMDEGLNAIVPANPNEPYDMKQIIEKVFDLGSFFEVHANFAPNAIVGFARLHGQSVGVVAQQPMMMAGAIDINAADKIARFVRFCDAFNIPLITFSDSPGFMPGVAQEHGGIIRHGAKIVYAYSEATVPKLTVVTRKGYGGAYIVMGSKHIHADLVFAWPMAEIAVMGAEGAVNILYRKEISNHPDPAAERARLVAEFREKFANPYRAAASGYVDDVIMPSETRPRLIAALELLRDKQVSQPSKKHGSIPL